MHGRSTWGRKDSLAGCKPQPRDWLFKTILNKYSIFGMAWASRSNKVYSLSIMYGPFFCLDFTTTQLLMHLEGTHQVGASAQQIWDLLMNPDVLAKITPGISTLEPTGPDTYKAVSDVKVGPVRGSFKGKVEVVDKLPPQSFVLKMKQNSKIGNVAAEGSISLQPISGTQTEIVFAGDAKLSGTLARTGQRVMSGVAKSLTEQFFKALEAEVIEVYGVAPVATAVPASEQGLWAKILAFFKRIFGG